VTNGGCNSPGQEFTTLTCGQTVCGDGGTYLVGGGLQYRDTDWWLVTLTSGQELTWSVNAEFPLLIGFVGQPCPQGAFMTPPGPALGSPCVTTSVTSLCLPAGQYVCFAAPSAFAGVACGSQYTGTLTCTPCEPPPPPANDNCTGAQLVACGDILSDDNIGATDDGLQPSCSFGGAPTNSDVWYRFIANNNSASINTCGGGSMGDTVITVYSGADCNSLVEIACNDDFCGLLSQVIANGLTNGTQYWIRMAGWNQEPEGTFTLEVNCFNGDCVQQQPGDVVEPEVTCFDEYTDTTNGGCNSVPPVYTTILPGQTVFGTGGNYLFAGLQYRDTDWYRTTLSGAAVVTWTVTAEFDSLSFILADGCPATILSPAGLAGFCETSTLSMDLAAGSYTFFVATSGFAGVPCGSQYRATLTVEGRGACCLSTGCEVRTQSACAGGGGTYLGNGTDCGGGSYTVSTCSNAMEDISGTGTLSTVSGTDDGFQDGVPIGFSFPLFGVSSSTVTISNNGALSFQPGFIPFSNPPIPNGGAPNSVIAPFWDDMWTVGVGSVHYQTLTSPDRFIVQWTNADLFPGQGFSYTFQTILFQGGDIDFRYGSLDGSPPASPTIGLEDSTGTVGTSIAASDIGTGNTCRHFEFVSTGDPCDTCPNAGGTGQFCSADTDGNCVLDVQDLANLLAAFGSVTGDVNYNPAVDYDNSGSIGLADLAFLLGQFGDNCN